MFAPLSTDMENKNESLNPQQSLDLITAMIEQAKGSVQKSSFHFLLWGLDDHCVQPGSVLPAKIHRHQKSLLCFCTYTSCSCCFCCLQHPSGEKSNDLYASR